VSDSQIQELHTERALDLKSKVYDDKAEYAQLVRENLLFRREGGGNKVTSRCTVPPLYSVRRAAVKLSPMELGVCIERVHYTVRIVMEIGDREIRFK
jgi:hypothetical protein